MGGGSIGGGASMGDSRESRVTTPVAPRRSPVRPPKITSPPEIEPLLKPAHVPAFGVANVKVSTSPLLLDAPMTACLAHVAKFSDGLVVKTGRPWTVMVMDFSVSVAKSLLKSKPIVPVNAVGEPKKLLRLPDRLKVSTTSALAPEDATRGSAAKTAADASALVLNENNVCPPAETSDS